MTMSVSLQGPGPQPRGPSGVTVCAADDGALLAALAAQAVIGNGLRVPVARCEAGSCGAQYADPAALGEADIRARAIDGGWREDLAGLLTCPGCQRRAPWPDAFRPVRPAAPRRHQEAAARPGGSSGGSLSGPSRDAGHPYPAGPRDQAAPQPWDGQPQAGRSPDGQRQESQPPAAQPAEVQLRDAQPREAQPPDAAPGGQPAEVRQPGPRHQSGQLPDSRPALR